MDTTLFAYKAHEIIISTETIDDKELVLAIHVRDVVTGKIKPIILIEGELEQLSNLTKRISKSIERTQV